MYEWVRYEKESRNQDRGPPPPENKERVLSKTLSFIAQKIFALEQMEEWFSEVGCWFLRIRTNCFSGFRMFGFSMDGVRS